MPSRLIIPLGPVANATTLLGNVRTMPNGFVGLPNRGTLKMVWVQSQNGARGPVYVSGLWVDGMDPALDTGSAHLFSGWLRIDTIANGDPVFSPPLNINLRSDSGSHLEINIRNDTGTSITVWANVIIDD